MSLFKCPNCHEYIHVRGVAFHQRYCRSWRFCLDESPDEYPSFENIEDWTELGYGTDLESAAARWLDLYDDEFAFVGTTVQVLAYNEMLSDWHRCDVEVQAVVDYTCNISQLVDHLPLKEQVIE